MTAHEDAMRAIDRACYAYRERLEDSVRFVGDLQESEELELLVELIDSVDTIGPAASAGERARAVLNAWRERLVQRIRDDNLRDYESSIDL